MTCFDATFTGVKRYSTTTDASGKFSLTVPCPVGKSATGLLTVAFDETYTQSSTNYLGHYEATDTFSVIDGGSYLHAFENLSPKYKLKQ